MNSSELEAAVIASFKGEIEAFKPGNVSVYAEGHDMTVRDFIDSAEVSSPILCQSATGLGQRVLESVKATRAAVGCNTNLGMLLLFAPIIMAAESDFGDIDGLRRNLERVLKSLSQKDADQVFEAIRIASPGGLGSTESQDVNKSPDCSLKEAMELASGRDSIALQYTNNFKEIFDLGFPSIKCFDNSWNSVKWSTVSCFMMFMSSIVDSHIKRKYGEQLAEQIRRKSTVIAEKLHEASEPETELNLIKGFDEELKAEGVNPGTSADLTAASLLVYTLTGKKNL
jgi:triphosphoribosyl-dephospho-CoA synthase